MRTPIRVCVIVAPLMLLAGCESGGHTERTTGDAARSDRMSSADQTRSMTSEMPRRTESGMMSQRQSEQQAMAQPQEETIVREETIVIIPVEPVPEERTRETTMEPRDRSSEEVTLRPDPDSDQSEAELAEITRYEPDFRQNYEHNFADTGYGYDQYRPAYHYGFELAKDPRYDKMEWSTLEMQAHRNWNESTMGPWDRYKDAVHYGWERGRQSTPGRG